MKAGIWRQGQTPIRIIEAHGRHARSLFRYGFDLLRHFFIDRLFLIIQQALTRLGKALFIVSRLFLRHFMGMLSHETSLLFYQVTRPSNFLSKLGPIPDTRSKSSREVKGCC